MAPNLTFTEMEPKRMNVSAGGDFLLPHGVLVLPPAEAHQEEPEESRPARSHSQLR